VSGDTAARELRHPALEGGEGTPLAAAPLNDRQRLAVVLQGAALVAHLAHAGWHLAAGWRGARVGAGGLLRVDAVRPGPAPVVPQEQMLELLALLFGSAEGVSGRGEARRIARALWREWSGGLAPLAPDLMVERLLELAPLLWEPAFAAARRSLVAEHCRGGRSEIWLAGSGRVRRGLVAPRRTRAELEELLAAADARRRWREAGDSRPVGDGPPAPEVGGTARDKLARARGLVARGKFESARAVLQGLRGVEAAIVRARCQQVLGEGRAARESLRRLAGEELDPEQRVEAAEVAARVFANLGEAGAARDWVARALQGSRGAIRWRAALVAAAAAWDRGEYAAMDRHLESARGAAAEPGLAWRFHHCHALRALAGGEGAEAVRHLSLALGGSRRRIGRPEAAALWNDLALARAAAGDLAGAERACLHAARLLATCEGPRRETLALSNLAEIRLRRGRLLGVRPILEASTAANRSSGNLRGWVQDVELWARLELVHGRAHAALERCREALQELERQGADWRRAELGVLGARALGWLGRAEEAARALDGLPPGAEEVLEAEEHPGLHAHAGDREGALRVAAGGPYARLWQCALVGRPAPAEAWSELRRLERYRAARLIFDLELAAPGSVPLFWLRRAAADLRRAGAGLLAERLEGREAGPWPAVEQYLRAKPADPEALAALFLAAGYPEARLVWSGGEEERVLVPGVGGGEELSAPSAGGRLLLRCALVDPMLRALFALAARDLGPGESGGSAAVEPGALAAERGGFVGASPALRSALARLARLAPTDLPLLVVGETGTGKELAARLVHRLSARSAAPLLPLNCAALSETLLLSDLFGHSRGAFTGADRDRAGVFEAARGGTVFLDEIGDLPPTAQGMLLRVLQEGEVRRVGESLPRRVDVRVVAATHRDLAAQVRAGAFREDLFFRLKVACVELPPLRDRGEDAVLLARHFLARGGSRAPRLAPAARARLLRHPWPGNVRELRNVVDVAAALAEGGAIEAEHLELPETSRRSGADAYHQRVDALRRRLVEEALQASGGRRAEAARRLGLTRQALSYLVRQLGIAVRR
jgi:two-component system NtrC family response regulator